MSKRGPYHKYFRAQDDGERIPRQTQWNRRNVCILNCEKMLLIEKRDGHLNIKI